LRACNSVVVPPSRRPQTAGGTPAPQDFHATRAAYHEIVMHPSVCPELRSSGCHVSLSPCFDCGRFRLSCFTLSFSCCTVHRRAWRPVTPMQRSLPPPLHPTAQSTPLATLHRLPPRELLKSARIVGTMSFSDLLLLGQKCSLFLIFRFSSVSWLNRLCSHKRPHLVVHSHWIVLPFLPHAISHFLFFDSNPSLSAALSVA
jgi:hypothetical protein